MADEDECSNVLPVSRCPFGHGTATVDPYPGYIHGKHPAVCPRGCVPLKADVSKAEAPKDKLKREATEFIELYGKENKVSEEDTMRRVAEVLESIESTGTYTHTIDEIRHGARVSWRNAPKCINRKFYNTLDVIDAREATTNEQMFEAIKTHLKRGIGADHIPVLMTVFRPQTPGMDDGPRIWNSQLIRYAGHRGNGEEVIGDPAELNFTDTVKKYFSWVPKSGSPGMFDCLPLVLQIDPKQPPSIFELPEECLLEVPIYHPNVPEISSLGLKWYGIPAVSNITLDLGGLHYTAAPFNGWYMVTEIATRNFGDESRYNLLPKIAEAMGIDSSTEETLWRDHALAAVNFAVLYSFKRARVSIVDHHTAAASFAQWHAEELKNRGYCPGNWKWIIPPTASSTSSIYLGLNKMTEYTLKPALVGGMSAKSLVTRAIANGFFTPSGPGGAMIRATLAVAKWNKRVRRVHGGVVLFASDGGRTQSRATWMWSFLRQRLPMIRPVNIANPDVDFKTAIGECGFIMLLASTTGSGQIPTGSQLFLDWVNSDEGKDILKDKYFSVCAFGSKAYPKFCAGGKQFEAALRDVGASEMFNVVCIDQLDCEDVSVQKYMRSVFDWLLSKEKMTPGVNQLLKDSLASGKAIQPPFAIKLLPHDVHGKRTEYERPGVTATLVERKILGSAERLSTVSVTFELQDVRKGVEYYKPGDHVAVWPRTSEAQGRFFAAHFGIEYKEFIEIVSLEDLFFSLKLAIDPAIPRRVSVADLFTKILDINAEPPAEMLASLANYVDESECKQMLEKLAREEDFRREWLEQTGVCVRTIFEQFPTLSEIHNRDKTVGVTMLQDILLQIPKLRARFYSVSSAPDVCGNTRFALTVGRLVYRSADNARINLGFCSDFIATLPIGTNVTVELRPAPMFRMPKSNARPIIMLCAGTGIAPFKGFVDQLTARSEPGAETWLIYGCRTRSNELYAQDMRLAEQSGHLTKYLVAYSREEGQLKTYVDAKMRQHADDIRRLVLNEDAHVYVCGDVRIETSVQTALTEIMGGPEAFRALERSNKYHLDIFGAFDVQKQNENKLANARKSLSMRE